MAKLFRETLRPQERAAIDESSLLSALAAEPEAAAWLERVVAEHGRVIERKAGDIITRKDDAGSLSYLLLEGALCEVQGEHDELIRPGQRADRSRSSARRKWWKFKKEKSDIVVIDEKVNRNLPLEKVQAEFGTKPLKPATAGGDILVGAGSVLTRAPYRRTVLAAEPSRLLSLHWRGLRRLSQVSARFGAEMNSYGMRTARRNARELLAGLQRTQLSEAALDALVAAMKFRFISDTEDSVFVTQGEPLFYVPLIVSGFGLVSRQVSLAQKSVGFVHKDNFCGLAALSTGGASARMPTTLKWVGDVNLLTVPTRVVMEHLLPALHDDDLQQLDPSGHVELQRMAGNTGEIGQLANEAALVDLFLDNHLVVGRKAMVIDQRRCVGCDDCVRACADTHGGVSRFLRTGPATGGYAVASACMHCVEPDCMINCPTDAIFSKFTREVVISDALCIGCGTCADACPYDNIRLVEMGASAEAKELSTPVAVKCDLCIDEALGPACVRACPHDAIARIDLTDYAVPRQLATREPLKRVQAKQ